MQSAAHGGARELDTALAAALEAAAERVRQRAAHVVMAARLATAVHMRRVAESTAAWDRPAADAGQHCDRSVAVAPGLASAPGKDEP